MKTVAIESNGFMVPEKWEECSQGQLTKLLPLQLMWSDDLDPAKVGKLKAMALKILMPGLAKFAKDLEEDQWFRLGRLTNWVFETKVTKKPFDYFSHEGASYYLPDENFANTTAVEVAMANIQYIQFTRPETPNPKAVLLLIATLCRPIRKDLKAFKQSNDWNGDKREEYNTILAEERAVQFGRLPFGVIMAISQYFEAMNGRFLDTFKDVYEPDPTADDEPPLYQNGEGLITTFMEIGKDGVFGDFDKVCHQNAHTIWMYLRDNNLKVKRANLRAEKARLQEG